EVLARLIEVVQKHVDEPDLAVAAQGAVAVGGAAQPVVVLDVDDMVLAQELAPHALGLARPPVMGEPARLPGQLFFLAGRHDLAAADCPAPSTMPSARRRRSTRFDSASSSTISAWCSRGA